MDDFCSSASAQQKRTTFQRAGGSKNPHSWTSSSTSPKNTVDSSFIAHGVADDNEILVEDERPVLPGVPIRAASLPALVRLCVQAFDQIGEVREEFMSFPRILFLMHQWFTSSSELATLFIFHYDSDQTLATCQHSCSYNTLIGCNREQYRDAVCHAIRYWIMNFPLHFDVDLKLNQLIKEFGSRLESEKHLARAALFNLQHIPSYDWIRNVSVREPDASRPSRKVSLIFNHLEPDELAHHLTFLEHKIMRRITFEDFKNYAGNGTLEDNPKLERSVSLFNGLSQWIQCVVLSRPTPSQRADVIVKFVHVAKNLRRLQNFNSLMGVVGSLSHSALARLTKTMDCVPAEERKSLVELTKLVSSASNFSLYRKALQESKGFKIPILGVHLKDMISLHTALPDQAENGLTNFRKMTQLSQIFTILQDLQQSLPPAQANNDLLNTLRVSLDLAYSEDEIYELSLSREPKTSTAASPTRSHTSDANGSYEKQVQTMVDVVFRNYDSNHDGFISKEEFQAILTNFPAIDAFFVLDENRDGMISKLELEKYLRNRKMAGSKHNFHETTYFKPTFCIHCSGLLWGLIKQGFKCRNCGVNAHKHCKDYMLHECKMGQLLFFPSSEPQVKRRGFRRRKKSSSQSESGSPPSPKLFNSLEQLSLSVESTDMPISASYGSQSVLQHSGHSNDKSPECSSSSAPSSSGRPSMGHQHSAPQPSVNATGGSGSSSSTTTTSTPKGTRRFSVLGPARTSHSVPSSPKLGLSNLSIPLWSPCRSLFQSVSSSSHSTAAQSTSTSTSAQGGSRGVRSSLGNLLGSPASSHRQKVIPDSISNNSNISQQKRQIGGVR